MFSKRVRNGLKTVFWKQTLLHHKHAAVKKLIKKHNGNWCFQFQKCAKGGQNQVVTLYILLELAYFILPGGNIIISSNNLSCKSLIAYPGDFRSQCWRSCSTWISLLQRGQELWNYCPRFKLWTVFGLFSRWRSPGFVSPGSMCATLSLCLSRGSQDGVRGDAHTRDAQTDWGAQRRMYLKLWDLDWVDALTY